MINSINKLNALLIFSILFFLCLAVISKNAVSATPYAEKTQPDVQIKESVPEQSTDPTPTEIEEKETGVVSPFSEADSGSSGEKRLTADEINFNDIEALGLEDQTKKDSLGKQLLNNSKRSVINALISALPDSKWLVIRRLYSDILTSPVNISVLQNDVAADYAIGRDLLTRRIVKLMTKGFYSEVFTLYNLLNIEPYNEEIARLGIISMLLSNQKSMACVEIKTFEAEFKKGSFWDEINAYCTLSLSSEKIPEKENIVNASKNFILKKVIEDKAYRFDYTPSAFEKLPTFERGLLIGENRINILNYSPSDYNKIPTTHLQALLTIPDMDNKTRILLSMHALNAGVLSATDFSKILIKIGRKAEKEKITLQGFEHISTLHWKHQDTFLPENTASTINELMQHVHQYGYSLLVPFLNDISKIKGQAGDSLKLDEIHLVIKAFLLAGEDMPVEWLDYIKAKPAITPDELKLKEILLISAALLSEDSENSSEKLTEIYKSLDKAENKDLHNLKNIIENIDNRTGNYANVQFAYEKGFDLDSNKRYTMPPAALINQLELSSKSHATGETVLLCNLMLQGITQQTIYPELLAVVARSLSEVGLSKHARKLLAEVILGIRT